MPLQSEFLADNRRNRIATILVLIVATIAAYANSFSIPFIFDDTPSIETNLTIRHLGDLMAVFNPPVGETVGGRPLLNLTFAFNYAIGGLNTWGYHFVNLLIHLAAGLALFGIIRRTINRINHQSSAIPVAGAIALLWLLHPLQTESVSYIVQRAESLVSLCYLLTLYGVVRAIDAPGIGHWTALAITACVAGVLSKEVMVTAPLLVLLYDRTFAAGTFRDAWRLRRGVYLGLFASLLLLIIPLVTGGRGGTAGLDTPVTVSAYMLTQVRAVTLYLARAFWPSPLIFDYGRAIETPLYSIPLQLIILTALLAATAIALWRRPRIGFLAASFFLILAPSSSVVPIATQSIAEHRSYLALATVLSLAVLGLSRLTGRWVLPICLGWAMALGWTTMMRNRDYQSDLSIWQDTVDKLPGNARAHHNLGVELDSLGQRAEALAQYRQEVRLDTVYVHDGYSRALRVLNALDDAVDSAAYRRAMIAFPDSTRLHITVGQLLAFLKRPAEAAMQYQIALGSDPMNAALHNALGQELILIGRTTEAIAHFNDAIRINPDYGEARTNLARADQLLPQRKP